MEFYEEAGTFLGNGVIPVTKYKSKDSGMNVYFADIESQVINAYFCYGVDQPEGTGIETLLWHLDSSGGLLPRPLRSDIIQPSWQHHGAENPLADRDQSSYVCCALGETAFLGTFTCAVYLLQNIEAVFDIHGYPMTDPKKVGKPETEDESTDTGNKPAKEGGEPGLEDGTPSEDEVSDNDKDSEYDFNGDTEPTVNTREFYFLSEAGEGAMAWEASLQAMFPGVRAFWNRLLCDSKSKLNTKMRDCYDNYYRPQNLTVIVTGGLSDRNYILNNLREYEDHYKDNHPDVPAFIPPWNDPLPPRQEAVSSKVKFVPRNPNRDPMATVCFGWRGCPSFDIETAMALKVFIAHVAVGPFWNEFVTKGLSHRISWCQLEYIETCSLVTVHGISSSENVEAIVAQTKKILTRLGDPKDDLLNIDELRAMANRVGWHYVRELETDPFLILAAGISKAEQYGRGDPSQVEKRIHPRLVFDALLEKPVEYWKKLANNYHRDIDTYVTQVVPRSYAKEDTFVTSPEVVLPLNQAEDASDQTFTESSRRASSRPRRNSSVVQDVSRSVADLKTDFVNNNPRDEPTEKPGTVQDIVEGHLEELVKLGPFPLGDHDEEAAEFEDRLKLTSTFLEQVGQSSLRYFPIDDYRTDGTEQHPLFPVNDMPFFTYLEDVETSFVYITFVLDTTHLDEAERKLVAPITAALGAILCPRPPGLDTDLEITDPNEFNPPQNISDSQVSLGLNGEMMQSIFATLIVRPEHYEWAVGMFHFLLCKTEFTPSFLQFIAAEAAKGLACSYKMQTADVPNYECFDSTELNLHSIIRMIYKQESNARLFVGRRRLDLVNEYSTALKNDPEITTNWTNSTWRRIVDEGRVSVQIATNVQQLWELCPAAVKPWKTVFVNSQKPLTFVASQPTVEREMMTQPCGEGLVTSVNHARPSCLTLAIPINPNEGDYAGLCLAAQLFSMAQKWVWSCLDEDDCNPPVLRMPCSYSNMLTLNLESSDVIGAMEVMKIIMNTDWPWLGTLLIATKLMVVNDPASLDIGPQNVINSALLAHLNGQPIDHRRDVLMDSLSVTVDDIKNIITNYLDKLFDPAKSWYALLSSKGEEEDKVTARLTELGYKLKKISLTELCTSL